MRSLLTRTAITLCAAAVLIAPPLVTAQAPATQASAPARQLGTVKAISGSTLTLTTSAGAEVTVMVASDAPVLQLPPGSTDLKIATPAKFEDVSVGDRVLATGKPGEAPVALNATRVILMKSGDIAARNTSEQQAWQRGLGGLVRSVDGTTITVVSGSKVLKIDTTPKTSFKRYASDSVAFSDVRPSSLADIQPGDQVRTRGEVSQDHLSITADAIVSGSFENLSGSITSIDLAAQSLTLTDLTTKKLVTVLLTQKSDVRNLTPEAEATFQSHTAPGAAAPGAKPSDAPPASTSSASAPGAPHPGAGRPRNAGFDLSQMLSRLPTETLSDLKPGQAVMIVASRTGSGNPTAVTLLSGVEQSFRPPLRGRLPSLSLPGTWAAMRQAGAEASFAPARASGILETAPKRSSGV